MERERGRLIKRENVRVCVPRYLQIGKGSLNELPEIIKILGSIKSLLIVTDKQMVAFGYVKKLQEVLSKAGLSSDVFDDTVPDPTDTVVLNGIKFLEKCKNDAVIGFGGGSPIDTAKAIAAMAKFSKNIQDYKPPSMFDKKGLPIIAIPTTAGTGSEVTHHAVVIDSNNNEKISCRGEGFVPIVAIGGVAILLLIIFSSGICAPDVTWPLIREYQKNRVCTLLDPTSDPLGRGFHTIQAIIAVGSGGFFGKGWREGTQSHLEFIPEKHTDFVFAVFAEEFGFLGNLVLILLFFALIKRGLTISMGAPTLFTRLLGGAISLIFFTYAFVNIGMVTGLLPVVGVPLPLLSYGGTALVTLGFGAGILMSIHRHRRLVQS